MHESSFEDVNELAVLLVENEMAPWHLAHLSCEGEIVVPAFGFRHVELEYMAAACAVAGVDESIMIDVFITELSESVSAGLVLHYSSEVEWIAVVAHRTVCDGEAFVPHVADAAVVICIRYHDHEGLVQVIGGYSRGIADVLHYVVEVAVTVASAEGDSTFRCRVELVVDDGVHASDAGFRRYGYGCIDVEVILVGLVRLDVEEMSVCLGHILDQLSFADVLCIVAVTEKDDVQLSVALCSLLEGYELIFGIFVVILCDLAAGAVVLSFEHEHHLAFAWLGSGRHFCECKLDFALASAACLVEGHPIRLALYIPLVVCSKYEVSGYGSVDSSSHRRSDYKIAVSGNTFEILPADRCLILLDSRLRHFESEIVLCNSVEGTFHNIGWYGSLADYSSYTETVLECSSVVLPISIISYAFKSFREYDSFKTSTLCKCSCSDRNDIFRDFKGSHQSPVICECLVTYSVKVFRKNKYSREVAVIESIVAYDLEIFWKTKFSFQSSICKCSCSNAYDSVMEGKSSSYPCSVECVIRNGCHSLRDDNGASEVFTILECSCSHCFQSVRQSDFSIYILALTEGTASQNLESFR